MNVLVINCGSSSLKYQLIDMNKQKLLASGIAERIGMPSSFLKHKPEGKDNKLFNVTLKDHNDAMKVVVKALTDKECGVIENLDEIEAIGHRITTGGMKYRNSIKIDDVVLEGLQGCVDLAPLHIPGQIMGIKACKNILPLVPMVAVFDTSFHQTIPPEAHIYPIPYEYYEKHNIRKYGFHGISHQYVSQKAADFLGKDIKDLKIITCHLGSGSSVSAVKYGKCIENSMGFTPLDGLEMGTRSGSIDPSIMGYISKVDYKTLRQVEDLLNKKSGFLGVSGISSDLRDLEEAVSEDNNERAKLAIDIFCYRVKCTIGEYVAAMDGVDVIVFTAGIGEHSPLVRGEILKDLKFFGVDFDKDANEKSGDEMIITKPGSKTTALVIATNEELMIAKEVVYIVG